MTPNQQAQIVLSARDQGDQRFVVFLVMMQARTGLPPQAIVAEVERMAATHTPLRTYRKGCKHGPCDECFVGEI